MSIATFSIACDAGDPAALNEVLLWAHERLPAVSTLCHAAGILWYDAINDVDREAFWAVCQPKVWGLLCTNQHECAWHHSPAKARYVPFQLGFTLFIYWGQVMAANAIAQTTFAALEQHFFSSTAAVWSQPGACHYSAANLYMDTMAQQCRCIRLSRAVHICQPFNSE